MACEPNLMINGAITNSIEINCTNEKMSEKDPVLILKYIATILT